ncbi:MAG: outer membrane protein assembly factor BamB [Gammaproteobacteria bacterium]|nr:outer membrane protein assembly factor BamB [Gammaproteobacteria bacterium]
MTFQYSHCIQRLIFVGVMLLMLGCSAKDNSEPPAELVDFEATINVEKVWSQDSGKGSGKLALKLEPYIEQDRLYVVDNEGKLSAFEKESGTPVWQTKTKVKASAGLGGGWGLLVFGSSAGDVVAFSQKTGEELWRTTVTSEVLAPPVVASDVVLVRALDGRLFALDAVDGSQLWVVARSVPSLSLRGYSSPVVTSGVVLAGFDNGKISAVSLRAGRTAWETGIAFPRGRTELERMVDLDGKPVVVGNVIYSASFQGKLAALNLANGEVIWSRKLSSFRDLFVDGDQLFATDADGFVWSFDRSTGAALWRQDKLKARKVTSPTVTGDYVVVADYAGYVHWLSRFDGRFVSRSKVDGSGISAAPQTHQDAVYVLSQSGQITVLKVVADNS